MTKNKHGLDRTIPAEVRRKIRQNSRFSCVVCRVPFCTYEHFDPEFKEAKEHDPDGMCLLCPSCQADTTSGRLSKSVIKASYKARRAETWAKSRKENFLFFDKMPDVKLGGSTITRAESVICTDEIDCLSVDLDEDTGAFLINMVIFDSDGKEVARISENTWVSSYKPWDFEFKGKVITFRSKPGDIIFRAVLDADANLVEITHLNMLLDRSRVKLEKGVVVATRWSSDRSRSVEISVNFNLSGAHAAIFLDILRVIENPSFKKLTSDAGTIQVET